MALLTDQLELFGVATGPEPKKRSGDRLAQPLSREEQRRFGQMYVDNIGLIKFFCNKLASKYRHCMAVEDIDSCVDIGFLRACRAWDPERGKLSTIFWPYAQGEVLHYLRSNNWSIKAPHQVRLLGNQARKLLDLGWSTAAVCQELGCNKTDLKDALVATSGVAHDVKGFDLHVSPYATPWEVLEAEEERLAA
jgi:DNA-directed RNA polymerase specialized sigma subunit